MKVKKETWIRTIITFIALVNSVLIMLNKNPLPYSEDEMYVGISGIFTVLTTLWSWWKNNSFSYPAIKADEYMRRQKEYRK